MVEWKTELANRGLPLCKKMTYLQKGKDMSLFLIKRKTKPVQCEVDSQIDARRQCALIRLLDMVA